MTRSLTRSLRRSRWRRWHHRRRFGLEAQADNVRATLAKLEADGVGDNPIASEARAKLDTLAESIEKARKSEASAR